MRIKCCSASSNRMMFIAREGYCSLYRPEYSCTRSRSRSREPPQLVDLRRLSYQNAVVVVLIIPQEIHEVHLSFLHYLVADAVPIIPHTVGRSGSFSPFLATSLDRALCSWCVSGVAPSGGGIGLGECACLDELLGVALQLLAKESLVVQGGELVSEDALALVTPEQNEGLGVGHGRARSAQDALKQPRHLAKCELRGVCVCVCVCERACATMQEQCKNDTNMNSLEVQKLYANIQTTKNNKDKIKH